MLKHMAVFATAVILALGVLGLAPATKPASLSGSWQVDTRHSDAQLITDGTTDFGKTKMDFTLGFGRLNGSVKIDDADPTKSSVVFRFYPATGMDPTIAENGKFLSQWLMNQANQTLVCFHSKSVERTADGRVQATGDLTVTRVDRNVDITPTEAYSGPVYGPPIVHRVSREATFVFDVPSGDGNGLKDGEIQASASTMVGRENFPQLLKAVVSTSWPPVVKDEQCQNPAGGSEDYRGSMCSGTFMEASGLPPAPGTQIGEDYSGPPSNFNAVVGNRLNIILHLRLMAKAGETAGGMN
jgi:polyisoprenoid-binding protein YceI